MLSKCIRLMQKSVWHHISSFSFFFKDYERQLQDMEDSKERALEELTEYYDKKLLEKQGHLEQVQLQSFLGLRKVYLQESI